MQETTIDLANWMSQLNADLALNQIILPGSHDAGMSELHHCDLGSKMNTGMVQTQNLNIGDQLRAGARYFDIRVDYDHRQLVTYHRSGDLGCNGQDLEAVMDESIAFLRSQPSEVFILKFSHIRSNRNKESDIKDRLDEFLANMNYRPYIYTTKNREINLGLLNLGACRGKMILVFDYKEYISSSAGHFRYHDGFVLNSSGNVIAASYPGPNISVCDAYSNTTDLEKMSADQLNKLNTYGGLGKEYLFLLSWTLTADFGTFFGGSIQELAAKANHVLPAVLKSQKDQGKPMPNIVYIDYVNSGITREIIQYNFKN